MFVRLGQPYVASLLVTDINGNRILNDSPTVTVRDLQESKYWNGITWQTNPCSIIMAHINNGVYSYAFSLNKVGVFNLVCNSAVYHISKSETLEIFDDSLSIYTWPVNVPFDMTYTASASGLVNLRIVKDKDATYWNGTIWTNDYTNLYMTALYDNVYKYTFIPDENSEYSITIYTDTDEVFYVIKATDDADYMAPIIVNNTTLRASDGSDTIIRNESGNPLSGTKVSVYDPMTKELIATSVSSAYGTWSVTVKPGLYYFMFEKPGYSTVGFERTVT